MKQLLHGASARGEEVRSDFKLNERARALSIYSRWGEFVSSPRWSRRRKCNIHTLFGALHQDDRDVLAAACACMHALRICDRVHNFICIAAFVPTSILKQATNCRNKTRIMMGVVKVRS